MTLKFIDVFMILFITMGPLKPAIVYVTLTAKSDAAFRRKVALRTAITASIVAILFVVAGEFLLSAFHVSIPALKMAGGLILLLYALEMIIGGDKKEDSSIDSGPSTNISIYPLALPLMATPQGLVAVTTFAAADPNMSDTLMVVGTILGLMAFNFVFLLGAHKILKLIGPAALKVVSVVVGLLLAALAIQLMIWGMTDLGVLEEFVATG
ncbi:MarC family protein [Maribellus sediminis]|uniref:MarC family protein n=1 Tax=Maribellus sediminis TaxID=2696285 RepID=UPI001430864A|nr:MarC family protein [Maribellus sediminis]